MNKRELIEMLTLLVIDDQLTANLVQGKQSATLTPNIQNGVHYERGIQIRYYDGYNHFIRSFYFPQTFQEEFYRYINRKFNKTTLFEVVEKLMMESIERVA